MYKPEIDRLLKVKVWPAYLKYRGPNLLFASKKEKKEAEQAKQLTQLTSDLQGKVVLNGRHRPTQEARVSDELIM